MSASERHLTDAELVQRMDAGEETEIAGAHVDRCPDCRARLGELRRAAATLTDLLELGAPTLPAPRYALDALDALGVASGTAPSLAESGDGEAEVHTPRVVWLVGLIAASLAALVLVSTPAGAWIVDHLGALLRTDGVAVPEGPASPRASPGAGVIGTSIEFRPTEPVLRLWLAGDAAPSVVVLRTAEGALVTAGLRPGREEASVVVAPGGLRIRAGRVDTLDVLLPQGLRAVRIYVGDRLLAAPSLEEVGAGPRVVPVS